jgi:hypothetical protein
MFGVFAAQPPSRIDHLAAICAAKVAMQGAVTTATAVVRITTAAADSEYGRGRAGGAHEQRCRWQIWRKGGGPSGCGNGGGGAKGEGIDGRPHFWYVVDRY